MSRCLVFPLAYFAVLFSASANAQLAGSSDHQGCVLVRGVGGKISATGHLTLQHMPGPPNFESIRKGDEDEPTLILKLPQPACIDDGGDFADPARRFDTVHVWTDDVALRRMLHSLIGQRVSISGKGYAADNALHFAPLVLQAKSVDARKR